MPVRLAIEGLSVQRGNRRVLEDISFEVAAGEIYGLLGPNGAGKTTIFQVLTGLLHAPVGRLFLDGRPVTPLAPHFRAEMGVVFQEPALDVRLSARENLLMGAGLYAVTRAAADRHASALLERAGLADRADEPVAHLSGGLRRRVELARALIHEPSILLLDEPTLGLDEGAFRRFWADLRTMREQRSLTLLLTTHRAEEAEYCDRLAFLDQGRIVACDSPEGLKERLRGDLLILECDDPSDVAQVLSGMGLEPRLLDSKVVLQRERAHEVVPRLVEALPAGTLRSVSIRRAGIAEVFLQLTGRVLDGTVP